MCVTSVGASLGLTLPADSSTRAMYSCVAAVFSVQLVRDSAPSAYSECQAAKPADVLNVVLRLSERMGVQVAITYAITAVLEAPPGPAVDVAAGEKTD